MSNSHASASSPVLDSPSKVAGLIFLNSPSRWSTCFLFLSDLVFPSAEGVPSDELSPFFVSCNVPQNLHTKKNCGPVQVVWEH
jgi:hypothetical protein